MKKKFISFLSFILISLCILNSVEITAKAKKETYREKYCEQIKKITTNSLEKMTPEKFSYSFLDMKSIATLKGPKYNMKTKNYDARKMEYVRIDVKKNGTLTFSCDGEYLSDAPYGMQNFQFGFFLNDDFNISIDEEREIFKYSGGQYIGRYYSSDEYYNGSNSKTGFTKLSRAYCRDEAFSIDVKKGETVYIGCGQNSINLRACFIPGDSSRAEIKTGDEELICNLLTSSERIEGEIGADTKDSIEISVKYGKKTYKQLIIPVNDYEDDIEDVYDYYEFSDFVDIKKFPKYEEYAKKYDFDKYDEVLCYDASYNFGWRTFSISPKGIDFGNKIKLTVKTSSGRKYSLTRKLVGDYIKRPDGIDEGHYNYKKHTITGRCSGEYIVKFQYRGKEYSTKATSTFIGGYEYNYTFPISFKSGKKMKITIIKDGKEQTAIFRT